MHYGREIGVGGWDGGEHRGVITRRDFVLKDFVRILFRRWLTVLAMLSVAAVVACGSEAEESASRSVQVEPSPTFQVVQVTSVPAEGATAKILRHRPGKPSTS